MSIIFWFLLRHFIFGLKNPNFGTYVLISLDFVSMLCFPVILHIALLSKSPSAIFTFEWFLFIMFSKVVYYIWAFTELHSTILIETLIWRIKFVSFRVKSFNCLKPIVWDSFELLYLLISGLCALIIKCFDWFSDQWIKIDWSDFFVVFF